MTSEQFKIPQEELERITEYVTKGIAASKASESNFYGDSKVFHDKMDKRIDKLEDIITKFIARAEPVIKLSENLTWSGKTVLTVCVAIAILWGGLSGVKDIISNLFK